MKEIKMGRFLNRFLVWWLKRGVPRGRQIRKHFLIYLLNTLGFETFEHPSEDDMIGVKITRRGW